MTIKQQMDPDILSKYLGC